MYLDVGWIFVRLVHGYLYFLLQPVLHLVSVTRELLKSLRLPQLRSVVDQRVLQLGPSTTWNDETLYSFQQLVEKYWIRF